MLGSMRQEAFAKIMKLFPKEYSSMTVKSFNEE
jgi:hypothetical protein